MNTVASLPVSSISVDDIRNIYKKLFPVLYYIKSEMGCRGSIIRVKKTRFSPEFIVIHPEDFEKIEKHLSKYFTLTPVKNAPIDNIKPYEFDYEEMFDES